MSGITINNLTLLERGCLASLCLWKSGLNTTGHGVYDIMECNS